MYTHRKLYFWKIALRPCINSTDYRRIFVRSTHGTDKHGFYLLLVFSPFLYLSHTSLISVLVSLFLLLLFRILFTVSLTLIPLFIKRFSHFRSTTSFSYPSMYFSHIDLISLLLPRPSYWFLSVPVPVGYQLRSTDSKIRPCIYPTLPRSRCHVTDKKPGIFCRVTDKYRGWFLSRF